MIQGRYTRIDFRESKKLKERIEQMIIGKKDDNKVIVTVKTASRNKDGRIEYETVESIDVFDAKPEEVLAAVTQGLESARDNATPRPAAAKR